VREDETNTLVRAHNDRCAYASPEQKRGGQHDGATASIPLAYVDTELVSGGRPFRISMSDHEMMRQIWDQVPTRRAGPSSTTRRIRRGGRSGRPAHSDDVDTVVCRR